MLNLHCIDSLAIDGSMGYDKRDDVVAKFHASGGARVFIFSSVGSAGLNLSIADVVVFFVSSLPLSTSPLPVLTLFQTQPWSAQDERQIRGRAHRQPQRNTVKAIHLLAGNTTDLLMNDMAIRKQDVFEAFVKKELGGGKQHSL